MTSIYAKTVMRELGMAEQAVEWLLIAQRVRDVQTKLVPKLWKKLSISLYPVVLIVF